jgi:hypothetical protein
VIAPRSCYAAASPTAVPALTPNTRAAARRECLAAM